MIILRHGRYISGSRIYRVGETLPDTLGAQVLVESKLAEIVADVKATKAAKKRDTEAAPKNDEGDS